jgi:glycosyltransferase involved in cell wall biosynthesis
VAYFADVAPYPRPLYGAQIRVERLIRELLREFDVALICQTGVSAAELASNWELGPRLMRIVTAPRRKLADAEYPEWGTLWASIKGAVRAVLPRVRPAFHEVVWSDELVEKARQLFSELPIDAVWASRTWMAEIARQAGARRIHVDVDDFEGRLMLERVSRNAWYRRKPLHWLQAVHLDRYERRLTSRFESVSVSKTEDLAHLARKSRSKVYVVPNGVDPPDVSRSEPPRPLSMIFVGALWYEPNAEALRWLVKVVLPAIRRVEPEASLIVAGRGPLSEGLPELLSGPGIEVHESPLSLEGLYARASLSLAPLFTGGGTSIKVLESLAYGLPVVATPVAVRGLGLEAGRHLAVAGSEQEFAAACADLLRNPERARDMAEAGRREVTRRFTWEATGSAARDVVRSLLRDS